MGLPEFVGDECDALREVRGHLPRPGHHAGRLPQGPGAPRSSRSRTSSPRRSIKKGDIVTVLDTEGAVLGNVEVTRVRAPEVRRPRAARARDRRPARSRSASPASACRSRGSPSRADALAQRVADDEIVCRCERVTAGEIRELIRGRHPRHEPPQGGHPLRHGRVRRQDLPQPDQAPLPRGGDPAGPGRPT